MTTAAPAPTLLDLADIQGGILRTYGDGFPKGRNFYLTVRDAKRGRAFVEALRPRITTAARWKDPERPEPLMRTRNPRVKDIARAVGVPDYPGRVQLIKPKVTLNLAFTFYGLLALGVPTRTLRGMPDEFIDGMEARAALLGDDDFLDRRDAVWRDSRGDKRVHILLTMYAQMNDGRHAVPRAGERDRRDRRAVQAIARRRGAARRRRAGQGALAGPLGGAARRAATAAGRRPTRSISACPTASATRSSRASSRARPSGCASRAAAS